MDEKLFLTMQQEFTTEFHSLFALNYVAVSLFKLTTIFATKKLPQASSE